jgi:hypothetical protein
MTKEELLKAQQSLLQRMMSEGCDAIRYANTAIEHWTDLKAFYKGERKELHKEQYVLSKLLKMVEKEISYEAMLKRQGRAFDSFIISQPYEEDDEPYVSEEAFKQKLQERMVQAMTEGAQLRGEYE